MEASVEFPMSGPVLFRPGISPGYKSSGLPASGVGLVLVGSMELQVMFGSWKTMVVVSVPFIIFGLSGPIIEGSAPYTAVFVALTLFSVELPVHRAGNSE